MNYIRENIDKIAVASTGALIALGNSVPAFASGEGGSGSGIVTTAINTAVSSVTADATTVIGAAVGLGAIFWGAQVLWSKFKAMAK